MKTKIIEDGMTRLETWPFMQDESGFAGWRFTKPDSGQITNLIWMNHIYFTA